MSVSIPDFWRLLAESRLLAPQQVQQLASGFGKAKEATEQASAKTLAQWLVSGKVLSRYQALVLLAGRSGPFYYGDYKVFDRVEQGRLSGCFRAVHVATGHPVLLKFLTGPISSQPQLWAAAASHVLAASAIVSPHVQRYFERVDLQSFKFMVSDDLRGSTLDELLARGRLPPAEACRIVRLAAVGLAAMHASGRVHGDVRPANLLLEKTANPPANIKLLFDAHEMAGPIDFADQQPASRLVPMADYLAPELMAAGRSRDPLSDIYALGCTLYCLVAGQPPFAAGSVREKLARHASEPIKPLETMSVPPTFGGLGQIVTYMMAKNPAVRYQSATVVAEQLVQFIEPAALRVSLPAPPSTLAVYEQVIRQKSAQVASAADQPAPSPQISGEPTPSLALNVAAKERAGLSAAEILRRRRAQQKRNMILGMVATALVGVGAIAGFGLWWKNQAGQSMTASAESGSSNVAGKSPSFTPASTSGMRAKNDTQSSAAESGSSSTTAKWPEPGNSGPRQQVVSDDGKTLWVSPTGGKPVSFRCVPPEGQVFLIVRPAAMLASPEGQRVLAALGPSFAVQREAWEAASGFKLDEVEQLHITLHNNDAKFPRTSFVVKTNERFSAEQLMAKWGNPSSAKEQGETYYTGGASAYYIPHLPEDERTFAFGEARDIKDVAAAGGAPPAVFREIERLRRTTDGDRHFTLLFYPQFLFNDDGEPLFAGERAKIRQPLAWLLGEQLQAACVSGNFGDEFYFEMRMLASLDKEPYQLAQELRERVDKVPAALEDFFVSLNPPAYWKKLAFRYPTMVRELHAQMRIGVENDQAIINSVLPTIAAHNLVLGGELLISTTPGAAVATGAAPTVAGPRTIAEALQLKTSYSFDQQSLEFAVRDLAEDVKSNLKNAPFEFAIKIIGDDLKIDGITRNQSIRDFKQENQTVADILTALVRKANPVTTVKDPSEKDQKLIWVIGPDPENPGKDAILITTRAAAAAKKYTLPPPFVAKK